MAEAEDVLGDLGQTRLGGMVGGVSPNVDSHLKTYTAGEDGSRLKELARELGLAKQREPRRQVRDRSRKRRGSILGTFPRIVFDAILDPTFEDIRMRSVYTSHTELPPMEDDEGNHLVLERMPSWMSEIMGETDAESDKFVDELDSHGHVGGDLLSAVLGIIKGMVGPAILYLPHGFASAGYIVAVPTMVLTTCMFLYSSKCLLDSWKLESEKAISGERTSLLAGRTPRKSKVMLSYPELAYRSLGTQGEAIVKLGIAFMQSGVCLTYLIFVPQNFATSVEILFGRTIPASYFLILMLALQIPLSWIRDIRKLTVTNLLANMLILYGLITCLGFAIANAARSDQGRSPLDEIGYKLVHLDPFRGGWFLFIGTSILLFEGSITLLVPLQEAVDSAAQRAAFPAVYQRVIIGIICFYAFFGITCWMSFGNDVKTVMTTSLPPGVLATSVQLAYSVAVIFTFPLQNFPSLEIACRSIAGVLQKSFGGIDFLQQRNFISSVLVCILALVAVSTMDSLDKVVSLMGSLLGCPIAFVFPPLIHTKLDPNLPKWRRLGNLFVATMGVCAMILASVATLITW